MAKHYSFTWKTVENVLRKTGGKCYYCGCDLPKDTDYTDDIGRVYSSVRNWHVDHMIPLSRGGDHNINNLVPSCGPCNMKKLTKTADEFMAGAK
jgi:5-methylcytosine-specific restriction endonuclease McrA